MSLITPDGGLLFWMVIIFAVVLFILAKWGFPAITSMVEKREEHIASALEDAKAAEEKLRNLSAEQQKLIEQAKAEQSNILKEASQTRSKIIEQAKAEARDEAAKILAQAKTQIAAEKESALADIRKEMSLLSVKVAEKVIREKLSSDDVQLQYLDKMIDEASKTDSKKLS